MRILHVIDFYPPYIGGMEQHVARLSRECVRRGHQVAVVTTALPGRDDAPAYEVRDGVEVTRVQGWARVLNRAYEQDSAPFHPPFPDPGYRRALLAVMDEFQPDVVHPHGWSTYSTLNTAVAERAAIVVTLHDYGMTCARKNLLHYRNGPCSGPGLPKCLPCAADHYGWVKGTGLTLGLRAARPQHRKAHAFVAISNTVLDSITPYLPRGMHTEIIPPFLVLGDVPTERPAWVPPTGEYLMFVGALGPHKGVTTLLEAYQELNRDVPLIMVGTQRPDTPTQWPDGVQVVKNVPHTEVLAGWRHATVGTAPSVWPEPFGLVAVEAMTYGVPMVATRAGAFPEIVVDGETGLLVPPGDATALADALRRLLDDPDLRTRMGGAARERAELYRPDAVVQQNLDVYQRAIDIRHQERTAGSR